MYNINVNNNLKKEIMPGKSLPGGGLKVKPPTYSKSAFKDDSTVEHPHTHRETMPGDAGQAGPPPTSYKPFKMKGFPMIQGSAKYNAALKHDGATPAGDMPHKHTPGDAGPAGPPPAGPPFHDPKHGETKEQTERRLREEGYSEEEITEAIQTGDIPDPGARDEQMMEDQGIEGGGMPVIEGGGMPPAGPPMGRKYHTRKK